jgi:peptide/nickel transport system permease protein
VPDGERDVDAPERDGPVTDVRPLGGTPAEVEAIQPELAQAVLPSFEASGLVAGSVPQWRLVWRRFRRHRIAMASLVVLLLIALACALAPWVAPKPYTEQDTANLFARPGESGFLLGSDSLGRDQLSRLLHGGRISLLVGVSVALLSGFVGVLVGSITGYYGGRLDNLLMRVTDLFLAIPFLVFLIMMSKLLGGSVLDIVLVLSFIAWMPLARIVRGLFLSLKEKEFVEAARSVGAPGRRIILRHILPNCLGPIIVNLTLAVAAAILAESALSFLGYGVQPPTPTWGNMLAGSRSFTRIASWLVWYPGLAILITVLTVNYIGDGLRDAFDPTQRRVRR